MQINLPPGSDDIDIEIRDSNDNVVRTGTVSRAEFECLPLLDQAKAALAVGDPQAAIGHLLSAIRATQGEEGIIPALDRARDLARTQRDASGGSAAAAALSTMRATGFQIGRDGATAPPSAQPTSWPHSLSPSSDPFSPPLPPNTSSGFPLEADIGTTALNACLPAACIPTLRPTPPTLPTAPRTASAGAHGVSLGWAAGGGGGGADTAAPRAPCVPPPPHGMVGSPLPYVTHSAQPQLHQRQQAQHAPVHVQSRPPAYHPHHQQQQLQQQPPPQQEPVLGSPAHCAMLDSAVASGHSVVCDACGAHVPPTRMAAHIAAWCRVLHPPSDEDDAGSGGGTGNAMSNDNAMINRASIHNGVPSGPSSALNHYTGGGGDASMQS